MNLHALILGLGLSCVGGDDGAGVKTETAAVDSAPIDVDGDGTPAGADCDDEDASVHPGADESCNQRDDDCDGQVDADAVDRATWYADADGDGWGQPSVSLEACTSPGVGFVPEAGDCDDANADRSPAAEEVCNGTDDDCDGAVDEESAAPGTWYADADLDGYGDPTAVTVACEAPARTVAVTGDCDDARADVHEGAPEDCDGADDDCDGAIDEDAADAASWYPDLDADGWGTEDAVVSACAAPAGHAERAGDCDDVTATTHPEATERCNTVDDDCDGTVDESASDAGIWYADADADGYGDASVTSSTCTPGSGTVATAGDCDDAAATRYPGADEVCDSVDQDCDGVVDETPVDGTRWYLDADGDGFGDAESPLDSCDAAVVGYVTNADDCDDATAGIHPDADEVCDDVDQDCDGEIDEAALDMRTWYADADADGYGVDSAVHVACDPGAGEVAVSGDCDDANASVRPDAAETCNGVDDDCDGSVDDAAVDRRALYVDGDGDGLGVDGTLALRCDGAAWAGDCDDADAAEPKVVDQARGATTGTGTLSDPLDTIQAGIDSASSCVVVFAGTYNESVDFAGKDLVVLGLDGADRTTIDATGEGDAAVKLVSGESIAARLQGFTLTGGAGVHTATSETAACGSSDSCTTYDDVFCGGGVGVENSGATLVDLVVIDNALVAASTTTSGLDTYYVSSFGGGVCAIASTLVVEDVRLEGNDADEGGGLYVDATSTVSGDRVTAYANTATCGAGLNVSGGTATLHHLLSAWNEASDCGGGAYVASGTLTLVNSTLAYDRAVNTGGALRIDTGTLTMDSSIVAYAQTSGGLYGVGTSTVSVTYSDIYGNVGGDFLGTFASPLGSGGNLSSVPRFRGVSNDGNPDNDDWRVSASSPCVNTGDPSAARRDDDGTRNDMGRSGGPGAQL